MISINPSDIFERVKKKMYNDLIKKYSQYIEKAKPENIEFTVNHYLKQANGELAKIKKSNPNYFTDVYYDRFFLTYLKLGYGFDEAINLANNDVDKTYLEASKQFDDKGFYPYATAFIVRSHEVIAEDMAEFVAVSEFNSNFIDYFKEKYSLKEDIKPGTSFQDVVLELGKWNILKQESKDALIKYYNLIGVKDQKANWNERVWLLVLLIIAFEKCRLLTFPENQDVFKFANNNFTIKGKNQNPSYFQIQFEKAVYKSPKDGKLTITNKACEEKFSRIKGVFDQFGFDFQLL